MSLRQSGLHWFLKIRLYYLAADVFLKLHVVETPQVATDFLKLDFILSI